MAGRINPTSPPNNVSNHPSLHNPEKQLLAFKSNHFYKNSYTFARLILNDLEQVKRQFEQIAAPLENRPCKLSHETKQLIVEIRIALDQARQQKIADFAEQFVNNLLDQVREECTKKEK